MKYSTPSRDAVTPSITAAMQALITPGGRYVGCNDALAVLAEVPQAHLIELTSLPLGAHGQRLIALRYFIENGETWLKYFSWKPALSKISPAGPARILALAEHCEELRKSELSEAEFAQQIEATPLVQLATTLEELTLSSDAGIRLLVGLSRFPQVARTLGARLAREARALLATEHRAVDLIYLATYDLRSFPATTVGEGKLQFLLVADKGEMGVRAVREARALGITPVVLYSSQDDNNSLQVRLAEKAGGFGIALAGGFRESYASFEQITARIHEEYERRFGDEKSAFLARSALYPGYGPLAENTAAIEHFRRHGIIFVGPMQDVVERAGDKRKFRQLAESIDAESVVPGIVIDENDPQAILTAIQKGYAAKKFQFPGRLKAANGGGGRGQMVIPSPELVEAAVQKVLGEIRQNGWDPGVMFEQNIPETIHLEVQVLRDRYGATRHFGMRDCSEQRASQKIQEEAPPALLRKNPELTERICQIAVRLAEAVGYVGACTVELMFKNGHFYLLEMNTRIQVEHPVTEEAHRILMDGKQQPLNLVQLQIEIARGGAIPFTQEEILCTHVAREFRINAEAWRADVKDSRDGKMGLFLPNGGLFEEIELPSAAEILPELERAGIRGIQDLQIRLDSGFEAGDQLVNKDPTFAKLIVAVQMSAAEQEQSYEVLRQASILVLQRTRMVGKQLLPTGQLLKDQDFQTNLQDHVRILEAELLRTHSQSIAKNRHVNWVIDFLRGA